MFRISPLIGVIFKVRSRNSCQSGSSVRIMSARTTRAFALRDPSSGPRSSLRIAEMFRLLSRVSAPFFARLLRASKFSASFRRFSASPRLTSRTSAATRARSASRRARRAAFSRFFAAVGSGFAGFAGFGLRAGVFCDTVFFARLRGTWEGLRSFELSLFGVCATERRTYFTASLMGTFPLPRALRRWGARPA